MLRVINKIVESDEVATNWVQLISVIEVFRFLAKLVLYGKVKIHEPDLSSFPRQTEIPSSEPPVTCIVFLKFTY